MRGRAVMDTASPISISSPFHARGDLLLLTTDACIITEATARNNCLPLFFIGCRRHVGPLLQLPSFQSITGVKLFATWSRSRFHPIQTRGDLACTGQALPDNNKNHNRHRNIATRRPPLFRGSTSKVIFSSNILAADE